MALDGLAVDTAVGGDGLHIQHRSLRKAGRLEEPAEGGHVAHERLLLNLLAKVGADVAFQVLGGIWTHPDSRKHPVTNGMRQVELSAQLGRGERVHGQGSSATAKEVAARALELACGRSREYEAQPACFDESVDFV